MRGEPRPSLSPNIVTGLVRAADVIAVIAAGLGAYALYLADAPAQSLERIGAAIILAALFIINVLQHLDVYRFERFIDLRYQAARVVFGWSLSFAFLLTLGFLSKTTDMFSRVWALLWFFLTALDILLLRLVLRLVMQRWADEGRLVKRVVVVGATSLGERLVTYLRDHGDRSVQILGFFDDRAARLPETVAGIPVLGSTDDLLDYGRKHHVDQIILTLPWTDEARVLSIWHKCRQLPVEVRLCSDLAGFHFPHRPSSHLCGLSMLNLLDRPLSGWNRVAKAVEDRVLASLILIIASPLIGLIALSIKLDSRGPVFFRQRRFGFNKQLINVWKFRTMYVDSTDERAERLTTRNDPRVTRVGAFLRKTSLDELPQFINVVRGDMSIVGPRPHAIAAKAANKLYEDAVEEYAVRHKVKPGITGWAQIKGWRGETDTIEKIRKRVEHDLYYIENWSLRLDLWIIVQTPFIGLLNRNAY